MTFKKSVKKRVLMQITNNSLAFLNKAVVCMYVCMSL